MIIWKPLADECWQCVNKVDKNAVAMVLTNSHCKEKEVVGHAQQKPP